MLSAAPADISNKAGSLKKSKWQGRLAENGMVPRFTGVPFFLFFLEMTLKIPSVGL